MGFMESQTGTNITCWNQLFYSFRTFFIHSLSPFQKLIYFHVLWIPVNSALRCCKMIFALKYIFLSNVMSQLLPCKCHILWLSKQLVSTSTEMTLVTVRCVTQWCWHSEHQDWTEQLWPPVLTRAARSWAELPCRAFQRDTRRTEPGALTVAAAHHSFPHSLIILLQLRRSATATSGHLPPNIMQWPGDCCKTGITTLLMTTANNGHNIQSAAFLHA